MEIAFRMQTEAPEVFDITQGAAKPTRARYGDGDFGRGCLMARRLVERGVRMVQVYFGNGQPWDNHDDILIHRKLAAQADRPIAALMRRSEGARPVEGNAGDHRRRIRAHAGGGSERPGQGAERPRSQQPRLHYVLAGGGVKGGMAYGATDDFGFKAVENPVHIHDLHATMLHLLGLDHTRLTYRYSGRDFRLTDVAGTWSRTFWPRDSWLLTVPLNGHPPARYCGRRRKCETWFLLRYLALPLAQYPLTRRS